MKHNLDTSMLSVDKPYMTFVWAEDKNGLIGKDNKLPWRLPGEMKHFVNVTTDDVVVMGRKTYESIPNSPLKNRLNVVLTRNEDFKAEGAIVLHSKKELFSYLKSENICKPIHVIGGSSIYKLFKNDVNVLYRTVIDESFDGDAYMPRIDYDEFRLVDYVDGLVNSKNKHEHKFCLYERVNAVESL